MTPAELDKALEDFRSAVERWRLTVVEDAPPDAPLPVQQLADLATDLDSVAKGEHDPERLRRRAHQLLLETQAWPLLTDLTEVAHGRGDEWSKWLRAVWLGLRDLGAVTGRIDRELASLNDGQGRAR